MKAIFTLIALVILGFILFSWWSPEPANTIESTSTSGETQTEQMSETESSQSVVSNGEYEVIAEESVINWAGKKPLIDGYINSGSIAVTSGSVSVNDNSATGEFTVDMNTLSVSETPTKPGSESTLEGHLQGERWFNVAEYPEASFVITEVAARADSDETLVYDVTGELTMKGNTGELTFPATIYQDAEGMLHANASFEFDRTEWGITSGSGSFFDDLADNVIDDMVTLSFSLVAEKQ